MIIYRYRDLSDNIIKYIGIVYGKERSLNERVKEHYRENRFQKIDWEISYIELDLESRTDAEYIESHYIAYYGTDKWLNIKKSGWGISSFVPTFEESKWKPFDKVFIDCDLTINPPEKTARHLLELYLSYKDEENRKTITSQIKGKASAKKNNGEYWIKVRNLMNLYINEIMFPNSNFNFRITHLGKITTELPFFGQVYYIDYSDSFYILSTKEEISRINMIYEAEKRFMEMHNSLKNNLEKH